MKGSDKCERKFGKPFLIYTRKGAYPSFSKVMKLLNCSRCYWWADIEPLWKEILLELGLQSKTKTYGSL